MLIANTAHSPFYRESKSKVFKRYFQKCNRSKNNSRGVPWNAPKKHVNKVLIIWRNLHFFSNAPNSNIPFSFSVLENIILGTSFLVFKLCFFLKMTYFPISLKIGKMGYFKVFGHIDGGAFRGKAHDQL